MQRHSVALEFGHETSKFWQRGLVSKNGEYYFMMFMVLRMSMGRNELKRKSEYYRKAAVVYVYLS